MTTTSAIRAAAVVAALVVLSLAFSFTSASVRFQRVHQQNYPRSTNNQEDGANYNNLDNSNDYSGGGGGQHQNRPQARQYACGRAMSNKRLADLLMLQQGAAPAVPARPKYRPFEIRTPRIIGGDETNPGEFPWTVSVKLNGQPICGGSLIDESWILTAAHCVVGYNPKNLTVRLGAYRIKDNTETQTVDSALSLFVVHKQYSMPRPFSNDIALLKMSSAVEFSDFIIPICLPNEDKPTTSTSTMTTSSTAGANQLGDISLDDFNTDFKTASSSLSSSSLASSSIAAANSGGASSDSFEPELGGIVVSTKMSDREISRCFKQLEQNYLNSIGMGSIETGNAIDGQMDDEAASSISSALINDLQSSAPLIRSGALDVSPALTGSGHHHDHYNEKAAIKLTSLPISNELLREIQSVGSMQSLHLGLQQGDIIAMASDLMATGDAGLPTGNAAANRERILVGPAHSADSEQQPAPSGRPLGSGPRQPSWMESPSEQNELTGVDYEHELAHVGGAKYSGELGIVVGWGWVRENDNDEQQQAAAVGGGGPNNSNKGYQSVTLQKVRLPILRNGDCEAWFRSQEKKITLLPSQFCAGYNLGGKDACRGDSGGPMIIEDRTQSGRYKLIGIVSAGIGCARPSLPGLYTRVASFLPWINAQIQRIA